MQDLRNILPLLEAIVSHIDDGVLITDRSGTILYLNPSAKILLTDRKMHPILASIENIGNISSLDLSAIMNEALNEEPNTSTTKYNRQQNPCWAQKILTAISSMRMVRVTLKSNAA